MKIKLQEIPIKDLFEGYKDSADEGVVAYGGKLNVRPAYQREFIYKDAQRNAVIDTVRKLFPLNVMYWVKNENGTYELLDGQQRTISICQYLNKEFSINHQYFHNLTQSEKEEILNYKLMVYFCEGTDKEKLDWFETINIAGEKLTKQELRNAMYTGPWLYDAKRHFSKNGCPAYQIANKYLTGVAIRQDYLETALKWIIDRDNLNTVEDYMSKHQKDNDACELWHYFQSVVDWVNRIFHNYRKEMKGVEWGLYYNKFKDATYNSNELEKRIVELMQDEDVTNKKGIYEFLLDGQEKHLSIRVFNDKQKRESYERQNGLCAHCHKPFKLEEMEAHHTKPWAQGGPTSSENCKMLCVDCHHKEAGK